MVVIDDVYLRKDAPPNGYDNLPDSTVLGILQNNFTIIVHDKKIIIAHGGNPAVWITGAITPASGTKTE